MLLKDNISIIIHTCDEYSHFWDGWYTMFDHFGFFDLGWPIYFCNEEIELPFHDHRILQIKTGKSKKYMGTEERDWLPTYGGPKQIDEGWSDRLITSLNSVQTKYVLYMQEDQWPFKQIDANLFNKLLNFTRFNDVNGLRLHRLTSSYVLDEYEQTNHFIQNKRVLKVKREGGFLLCHQPTIWNREFLLNVSIPGEGFRDNEYAGTERVREKYKDPKIFLYNHHWFLEKSASAGGLWIPEIEWEYREVARERKVYRHFNMIKKEAE
jgi:hypothetical protein